MSVSWVTTTLGDVSSIAYGYTESASSDAIGPKFLRITDIQGDDVDWSSVPYCPIEPADLRKHRLLDGDIVFARTGATTGKSFLVRDPPEAVPASYLIRLRLTDPGVTPEFLALFFRTEAYWSAIREGTSGSAQGGFNASKLAALKLVVPPLEEQRRIVAVLDDAFAAIATATANAEKNLANARELFILALNEELGRGYPDVPMKEFCSFENGDRGENYAGRSVFVEEGVPIINAGHLTEGTIDTASMNFITRERFDLLRSGKIKRGDILFCLRGSLGKFAYNEAYQEGAIASSLIIIRPGSRVLPEYLCAYLRSDFCAKMIKHYENGAAQPNLGGKSLEKFLVPLPSLAEQRAMMSRLRSVQEATLQMEELYSCYLAEMAALKQSLLHRAFSGELTEREALAA